MCHQVKDTCGECADTQRQEHISELAYCGVSEYALDVVLHKTNRCREECSEPADDGDHRHGLRSHLIDEVAARDHVNAGSDHRGRVNESTDGSWTFHGIRQPNI